MKEEGLCTMTVNEILTSALVLYMQGGKEGDLEYVSRSECTQLGWFFWLKNVPGVYEIELKGDHPETNRQGSGREDFYVRYYPALDEEVLEEYSVQEQILRFDSTVFDDCDITTDQEEHEICPCCGVPRKNNGNNEEDAPDECHYEPGHKHSHEHHHDHEHCCCDQTHEHNAPQRRAKGIPSLLKKFDMNKRLFSIGMLAITADSEEGGISAELETRKRFVETAKEAITVRQGDATIELVEKGGVNRNVPGFELSERFMKFFGGNLLAAMVKDKQTEIHIKQVPEMASDTLRKSDEDSDVIIQYIFTEKEGKT
jgi:hypothetical protein